MAKEDVTLKVLVEPDLKELENKAKTVSLSPATKASLEHNKKKADIALEGGDIKAFRNYINKYIDILKNAVANMPGINKEFVNLQKRLSEIIKSLPELTAKKAGIEKNFVGKVSNGKYTKEASISALQKAGISNPEKAYEALRKATELVGNNWSKLTNEIATNVNSTKEELRHFRDIVRTAATADQKQYGLLEKEESAKGKEQNQIEEDIKNLGPVSEEDAKGLNALYESLVKIQEVLNQKASSQIKKQNAGAGSGNSGEGIDTSNLTGNINKQSSSLGKAFKQFTLYAVALRTAKKALREAVHTVKELDKALTEQAMVTGLTRDQTYSLLTTYQDMASRLGATTKEVSSTMTQFLRQGRSINESLKLTEAAVSAAKVAGISAADSINYLTTAINGFRLSADDAMKVSDKFAAVAASAATSYEEIAIALSKVAAQANLAGMSIDYTTALLTKGIETTREAPETIGTALKTVIARMRELGDYGETLEGDIDINNVESQLAYIGIALRDTNGELRSTEEVLNDLGGQWDDLNANQQAAIAKALAGTRQQSRLIAMMSDYERVIELQQIAERSAGATMAQMATYMEGMDAALNKINVAWEKIVSSIVDNKFIIGIVDWFSGILDYIGTLFEKTWAIVPIITLLIVKGTEYLGIKLQEQKIARETAEYNAQMSLARIRQEKAEQQAIVEKFRHYTENRKKQIKADAAQAKQEIENLKATNKISAQQYNKKMAAVEAAEKVALDAADAEKESIEQQLALEEKKLAVLDDEEVAAEAQVSRVGQITQAFSGFGSTLQMVASKVKDVVTAVPQLISAFKAAKASADASNGSLRATSAAYIPVIGWAISLILQGISVVSIIGNAISALKDWIDSNKEKEPAEKINDLSAAIYNLNKKSTALDNVVDKFDKLDHKVLKTNNDLEEMNELLESAADNLSDEEKEVFEGLTTQREKRNYLEQVKKDADDELEKKRDEQRRIILDARKENGSDWEYLRTSKDAQAVQARDAMYALNNASLYQYIDRLKEISNISDEAAYATQKLTQSMLEQLDPEKAAEILDDPEKIKEYVNAIKDIKSTITNAEGNSVTLDAASILSSDDYTIHERVKAFRELRDSIKKLDDPDIEEAFETINKEWATFDAMTANTLDYIDKIGADINGINDLAAAIQKLGKSTEESADAINTMFDRLESGEKLYSVIADMFGTGDEYNAILNAYDKAFGTTVLNMGQNVDKLKNTIDSFYDKAKDWAEMSETDRTSFISENMDLFEGKDGAELLAAFESGNYNLISEALANNDALAKQRIQLIKDVDKQLEIELARSEGKRNEAYIKELQEYKRELEDVNKIYLASLKLRYDQQQEQINMYKDMLQQETDALTEALNKRKEAYQKYFDTINEDAEKADYDEQSKILMTNITKLSSSTNADAVAKSADLAKQLADLEKERLKELRERTQEAVIQGIDDEVTKISDNLEKLLSNEQALLNAIMKDKDNPSELIASLISAQYATGNNTELGMQSYLQNIQSTFASLLPNVDWSDVEVEQRGDSLILNIMGKEIQLNDGEQQTIYDAIQQALKQLGYN